MVLNLYKKKWQVDLIIRLGSFWVGCHYSSRYNSYCIALFPCVVVRIGETQYIHDPGILECKG